MGFTKSFRTPAQLTGVARAAFRATCEQYATASLLPSTPNFTLDYNFSVGASALPPAANFRSFNTGSDVNVTSPGETRSGKLPPLSIRMHVNEYQQLKMYGQNDAIGAKFEEYAELNATSIAQRVVLAQAEAIQDGKVTISERGLSFEVDFGRKAALTSSVTVPWSDHANADPIADLMAFRQAFGTITGLIISRSAMTHLMRNASLIAVAGVTSKILSEAMVRSALSDFGFGNITINEEVVNGQDGVERPLFDADKVIFLGAGQVGRTDLGVTAEAIDQENGISGQEQAGLFSGAYDGVDPSGFNVLVSAIALPVVSAANKTGSLDVL